MTTDEELFGPEIADIHLVAEIIDADTGELKLAEKLTIATDFEAYIDRHVGLCALIHQAGHDWVMQLRDPDDDQIVWRASSAPEHCVQPIRMDTAAQEAIRARWGARHN